MHPSRPGCRPRRSTHRSGSPGAAPRRSRHAPGVRGGTRRSTGGNPPRRSAPAPASGRLDHPVAMVVIPSLRSFPFAFGIIRSRTAAGRNSPASASPAARPGTPPPRAWFRSGRVAVPPPASSSPCWPAPEPSRTRNAGSETRLNRSSNRREGSSPAQRCSLACISVPCVRDVLPGHGTGIHRRFFGHYSPSLHDTLPPFPMYAALPGPEYYGGSAPPAPSAGIGPAAPAGRNRTGTARTVPAFTAVRSTGRHPALPLRHRHGYAAGFHRGLLPLAMHARPGVSRPPEGAGPRRIPAQSARFELAWLKGLHHTGSSRLPSILLAGPGPSGSTSPSRLCRGCSRPPRRPRIRLPSAPPRRCDGPAAVSHLHTKHAPRGAPRLPPASPRRHDGEEMDGLSPPSVNDSASWRTQAFIRSRCQQAGEGVPGDGRRIDRRPAGAAADIEGQAAPGKLRVSARRARSWR